MPLRSRAGCPAHAVLPTDPTSGATVDRHVSPSGPHPSEMTHPRR